MNVPSVVRHSGTGPTPLELVSGRVLDLRTTGLNVLVLGTLYLYASGVFINRRAFRCTFCYIVWTCLALSIEITVQLSPGYDLLASTAELLREVLFES